MLSYCQYSTWIFFICFVTSVSQSSLNLPRHYLAQRDFFNFFKAGEYSIIDPENKTLYYRIESRYHLIKRVEIIRYPSKKQTARLSSKVNGLTFEGDFSILDEKTNQWIDGEIEQNFRWFQTSFLIHWNGHQIRMENNGKNLIDEFRNEENELLAEIQLELGTVLWRKKYNMKVHTTEYPEEIYLIALSASDRT